MTLQDPISIRSLVLAGFLALLCGCATPAYWVPMLDTASDPYPDSILGDQVECQQMAFGAPAGDPLVIGLVGGAIVTEAGYQQVFSNCMRGRGHAVLNY